MTMTPSKRWRVLQRDNFRCRYCGRTGMQAELQVDHMLPVSKGGHDTYSNLVTACVDCNQGKRAVETEPYLAIEFPLSAIEEHLSFDMFCLCNDKALPPTVGDLWDCISSWHMTFTTVFHLAKISGARFTALIETYDDFCEMFDRFEESKPQRDAPLVKEDAERAIAAVEAMLRAMPWRAGPAQERT